MAERQTLVSHENIRCDECGVYPLVGTRYKARHIYDYDLCETCMNEYEGEQTDYVAIETPVPSNIADQHGPPPDNTIKAFSPRELAEKLLRNDESNSATLTSFGFQFHREEYKELERALASNTHLHHLDIHMCNAESLHPDHIAGIARGIMMSTSIKRIVWHIPKVVRSNISEEMKTALREMVEKNQVLERLCIEKPCHSHDSPEEAEADTGENQLVQAILEGLKKNMTLRKLRLDCFGALSPESKDLLLDVVEKHKTLSKVYTTFGDYRLELALACKRGNWIMRLSDTSATAEDQISVFKEALELTSVDTLPTVYHLLRSYPEALEKIRRLT